MRSWRLLILLLALAACAKSSKNDKSPTRPALGARLNCKPEAFVPAGVDIPRLQPSETCAKFVGYLIASLTEDTMRYGSYWGLRGGVAVMEGTADSAGTPEPMADSPAGHSTTNVQEAGIDEADIVKTDGKHIYLLHGNTLKILKSWPPTELSVLSSLQFEGMPTAMLLFENRLAVVSDVYSEGVAGFTAPRGPMMQLSIIDAGDPQAPVLERTIDMEVSYLDARLVNGRVVLAGQASIPTPALDSDFTYEPPLERDDEAAVRRAVADAITQTTFEDWLPTMLDSARGERELMVDDFDQLYVPTVTGAVGSTVVVSLDLAHAGAALNKVVLAAEGSLLYATADALYVAYSNRWWWWGMGRADSETYVHRMRLNEEAVPHYTGSVTMPGWIDTPFWMSEYDGHLRIVSSADGANRLRTFKVGSGDPELQAEVKGYAPGETITGVRFRGPRAYVSTYFVEIMKDPFFTFDLADPAKPKLLGALEMPGFTTYIHPLNDDYVLAVGMFAAAMGDPVTSVQVQVFDVRDFAHPVTASQHVFAVGDTGVSFSEALVNHHAFTFYEPKGIFALPLAAFDGSWSTAFNGLVAMQVGADASLTELGRVNHYALGSEGYWASDVRRSVVMEAEDDRVYVYSISAQGVIVNDIDDFSTVVDSVALPVSAVYGSTPAEMR